MWLLWASVAVLILLLAVGGYTFRVACERRTEPDWLDAVALLPLCILGLHRLLDDGDFKLYVLTLALMLFCNYYIGGIVCIFIFFYFPVLYFMKKRDLGVKGCLKKIRQPFFPFNQVNQAIEALIKASN